MSNLNYLNKNKGYKTKYGGKKKSHPTMIAIIKNRLERDMDTRIIIAGESGIGKSTLALDIAENIDPTFTDNIDLAVKELVTFDIAEYMQAVNSKSAGSVLIMDEAGQAAHHREYMNAINIILSKTMQGFRYKKLVTIYNVPSIDMVDKDARSLVHYLMFVDKRGQAVVYRVISSRFGGKTIYKKIKDRLNFKKPSVKLWHRYEKKKFKVQQELYEQFAKTIEERAIKPITNVELINTINKSKDSYMKNERLNVRKIQGLGIGRERAETIRSMIERGIEMPKVR